MEEIHEEVDNRPQIYITTDEFEVNDAAVAALRADSGIYQRSGALVSVLRQPKKTRGLWRPEGSPGIYPMPPAVLRERLTNVARWMKRSDKKEGEEWVPAHPAPWTVAAVHARGTWTGIRPLTGLTESPVMRPDGSILQEAGYDEETQLLYIPSADFPKVPERPTMRDAQRARDELLDVVADFPFEKDEHRSAWVAALLTPIAKPAIEGNTPLFLVDANTPGTGKTLLVDTISQALTGHEFAKMSNTTDDDEMRKTLLSIALQGDQMVLIDNIRGVLGTPSLDKALTARSIADRQLGKNDRTPVPLTAVFYGTGNNVACLGDIFRRTIVIRLSTSLEHPEDRTGFRHPQLLAHVQKIRPQLVTAALTMLRAYVVAGRPEVGVPLLGSFEPWTALVARACVWSGLASPVSGATRAENSTPELSVLRGLVLGMAGLKLPTMGMTAKGILAEMERQSSESHNQAEDRKKWVDPHAGLRAVLEEAGALFKGETNIKKFGKLLERHRERVIDGWRIVKAKTNRDGVAQWTVMNLNGTTCGDSGGDAGVSTPRAKNSEDEKNNNSDGNTPRNRPHNPARQRSWFDRDAWEDGRD